MATGDLSAGTAAYELERLRTERDELARRCAAAEAEVARLTRALAAPASSLSLFDGPPEPGPLGDGTDQRVLSLVLGAVAVVSGMVAVLTLINGRIATPFGVLVLGLTAALAWGASRTRVVPVEVSVVRGMVYVTRGDDTHRFDLRKPTTEVRMVGRPGEPGWAVHFPRRHAESVIIDATMVDADEFTRQVREHRPDL
ncbi:hypothetical protein [Nocardioides sp.]|uniref:hypothetical protein n=1 Tax=Nocardioides sp. TaxID=35761 RepID=UPI0035171CA7